MAAEQYERNERLFGKCRILVQQAKYRDLERLIDDRRIDVRMRDENRNSLLHLACQVGNKRIVKLLLRNNCEINYQNCRGNTPLHYCCQYKFGELGDYLISKRADPNRSNQDGLQPSEGIGYSGKAVAVRREPEPVPPAQSVRHAAVLTAANLRAHTEGLPLEQEGTEYSGSAAGGYEYAQGYPTQGQGGYEYAQQQGYPVQGQGYDYAQQPQQQGYPIQGQGGYEYAQQQGYPVQGQGYEYAQQPQQQGYPIQGQGGYEYAQQQGYPVQGQGYDYAQHEQQPYHASPPGVHTGHPSYYEYGDPHTGHAGPDHRHRMEGQPQYQPGSYPIHDQQPGSVGQHSPTQLVPHMVGSGGSGLHTQIQQQWALQQQNSTAPMPTHGMQLGQPSGVECPASSATIPNMVPEGTGAVGQYPPAFADGAVPLGVNQQPAPSIAALAAQEALRRHAGSELPVAEHSRGRFYPDPSMSPNIPLQPVNPEAAAEGSGPVPHSAGQSTAAAEKSPAANPTEEAKGDTADKKPAEPAPTKQQPPEESKEDKPAGTATAKSSLAQALEAAKQSMERAETQLPEAKPDQSAAVAKRYADGLARPPEAGKGGKGKGGKGPPQRGKGKGPPQRGKGGKGNILGNKEAPSKTKSVFWNPVANTALENSVWGTVDAAAVDVFDVAEIEQVFSKKKVIKPSADAGEHCPQGLVERRAGVKQPKVPQKGHKLTLLNADRSKKIEIALSTLRMDFDRLRQTLQLYNR